MSAVPHSSRYENSNRGSSFHNDNSRPKFGSPLSSNDRDIKRFDAKMHVRMNEAVTREDWTTITNELIAASGKIYTEVGGLRGKVKEHFLGDCPDPELRKKFNQALMPKKAKAIRHQAELPSTKRQEADAKRKARSDRDRDARLKLKGPSNRTEPNHGQGGGKQKAGKKKH